jgi:hypothetical protein
MRLYQVKIRQGASRLAIDQLFSLTGTNPAAFRRRSDSSICSKRRSRTAFRSSGSLPRSSTSRAIQDAGRTNELRFLAIATRYRVTDDQALFRGREELHLLLVHYRLLVCSPLLHDLKRVP